ncbi:hypothetical protein, partial [Bradyrhizobium sp.]|uniref:hypothetical protein n=1 Tax=Bradyrhizobium sp. TaxID=376 RepID=UPI003C7B3677
KHPASLRPLNSEGLVLENSGRVRTARRRRMREIVLDYQSIRHNQGRNRPTQRRNAARLDR